MNPRLKKSHAVHDKEAVWRWSREHDTCACCHAYVGMIGTILETHHIIKAGRSDEPCNLLRLCRFCHKLAEGEKVPHPSGGHWPNLSLAMCLKLKMEADPHEWKPERLAELRHSNLPDLKPLPELLVKERLVNNGRTYPI